MSDNLIEKMAKLEEKVSNIEEKVDDVRTTLREFIDKADSRYASKKVEAILWGAGSVIGVAILLAALSLILIK